MLERKEGIAMDDGLSLPEVAVQGRVRPMRSRAAHVLCGGIALGALLALASTGVAADGTALPVHAKKLIATGWDHPEDTAWLRANVEELEKRPFDGIEIGLIGRLEDGSTAWLDSMMTPRKLKREWFAAGVADLRATKFRRFTDNFLCITANPGDVDWFDDWGWQAVVDRFRVAAWAARQSGAKGLLFDPEPYTPPYEVFNYGRQPGRTQHTVEEYRAQARQRGREVMRAIAEEYPDITLLCYFMNSINRDLESRGPPPTAPESTEYALYAPFIDGWLDVAPPTATFVDGCESAYPYNSESQFRRAYRTLRETCLSLVAPEDRARYRAQVQVGFPIYMDAYVPSTKMPWHIEGKGRPLVDRLWSNTRAALAAADEYVWVYGEHFRWWPPVGKGPSAPNWSEAMPGCEDALRSARTPDLLLEAALPLPWEARADVPPPWASKRMTLPPTSR
jgi:hypothetical protein